MTRYKYSCHSKSGTVVDGIFVRQKPVANMNDRDELMQRISSEVAMMVHCSGIPWDPFNIKLLVQAQNEPQLQ